VKSNDSTAVKEPNLLVKPSVCTASSDVDMGGLYCSLLGHSSNLQ
jgi:hypothetical protein